MIKSHHIIVLALTWLLPALPLSASVADTLLMRFEAAHFPITEEGLPHILKSYPLPTDNDYAATDFDVQVTYPEYQPLTAQETAMLKKHLSATGGNITSQLQPETFITHSRGASELCVTLCPIIMQNKRYMRLVGAKIVCSPKPNAHKSKRISAKESEERYASHSVLSSGRWVKIAVTQEGMYELTPAKLREWGFNDIARVKLYGYGGRMLPEKLDFNSTDALVDDLREEPLYRRSDGSAIFYANGVVRWTYNTSTGSYTHTDNYYSAYSYYFLTEGDEPMKFTPAPPSTAIADRTDSTIPYYALYEKNGFLWPSIGRRMFDAYDFSKTQSASLKIDVNDADDAPSQSPIMEVVFSAANPLSRTTASVSLNGNIYGNINCDKVSSSSAAKVATSRFTLKSLQPTNTVSISTNTNSTAHLDYIRINYTRILNAQSAPFSFYTGKNNLTAAIISNADANTQVWELAHGNQPTKAVYGTLEGTTYTTDTLQSQVRYALVNVARNYPSPIWAGEVANQDLHADSNIDYVIVIPTSGKLMAQAERLAELHRTHDNLKVKVVRAGDIYNEFSSGTPDATAIRRYMKMLYDRAEDKEQAPRYLLLFGASTGDNRMLTEKYKKTNPDDYLLAFEMDNSTVTIDDIQAYCTDDYFGMLDDNEGNNITADKIDLGIGRLICTTEEEARIYVDKIETYMSNSSVGAWKSNILLIGDYGDNNSHMDDAERVAQVINEEDPRFTIKKIYPDSYVATKSSTGMTFPLATKQIVSNLVSGSAIVNYSGHGSPIQLSHANFIVSKDLQGLKTDKYPVWILASCEILPFDLEEESFILNSAIQPDGGCIASMCATRSVYASYNNPLNRFITKHAIGKDASGRRYTLGDALRIGKTKMLEPLNGRLPDNTMNKLKFMLLGDPALVLSTPHKTISIDSINGAVPTTDVLTIRGGSAMTIEGHTQDNINGFATVRLYGAPVTIWCKNNAGDDLTSPYTYQDQQLCLSSVSVPVENGKFKTTLLVPTDINYSNDKARISIYAVDESKQHEYSGIYEQFMLNGTDERILEDSIPPVALLYFNDESFPDGGVVLPNSNLEAHITDNYGINSAGSALGHSMTLVFDEDESKSVNINDYFSFDFGSNTSGHLSYPLPTLSLGLHKATLRVWDINNNYSTSQLYFNIQNNIPTEGQFALQCPTNPITTSAQFIVYLPGDYDGSPVNITLYDGVGKARWSKEVVAAPGQKSISVTWSASGSNSISCDTGIYFLRAQTKKRHTKSLKLIVNRQ